MKKGVHNVYNISKTPKDINYINTVEPWDLFLYAICRDKIEKSRIALISKSP